MGAFEHAHLFGPEARVAHAIATMLNPELYPDSENCIEISNEELARLVGLSRQTTNQALQVLEKVGLIAVKYRMIKVLDIVGLLNVRS